MSPSVKSKDAVGATSAAAGPYSVKVKVWSKPRTVPNPPPSRKARRPSSLQYSLRLNPLKKQLPAHVEAIEATAAAADPGPPPGAPAAVEQVLVAPKATPEDSLIGSCCSSSIFEEQFGSVWFLDGRQSPSFQGIDNNTQSAFETTTTELDKLDSVITVVEQEQWRCRAPAPAMQAAISFVAVDRLSGILPDHPTAANEKTTADPAASGHCPFDAKLGRISNPTGLIGHRGVFDSQYHHQQQQQLNYAAAEKTSREEISTTTEEDTWQLRATTIVRRSPREAASCVSLCHRETNTLAAATADEDDEGHGGSSIGGKQWGTPPPWTTRSRFSHMGSHALDVFFSPEETSPPAEEPLWRPVVATTTRGSPTDMGSSSSDPLDGGGGGGGDAVSHCPAAEGLPSTRDPAASSLIADDDDDDDDSDLCVERRDIRPVFFPDRVPPSTHDDDDDHRCPSVSSSLSSSSASSSTQALKRLLRNSGTGQGSNDGALCRRETLSGNLQTQLINSSQRVAESHSVTDVR